MSQKLFKFDFPGGLDSKASVYNAVDPGSIPGLGRSPGEGNGNPLQLLLPGRSHGWRSLVGYSPWGRKESDMTERLHFLSLFFLYLTYGSVGEIFWDIQMIARTQILLYCYSNY